MKDRTIIHVPRRFALDEWGGTESVIYNLCRQQQAAGWQPEIHTSRALAPKPVETWRDISIRRYNYTYPFFGLSDAERLALDKKGGNLLSLSLLAGLACHKGVRIFHAHVTKRMGATVRTAARLRKRPFVVTLHGNIFDVPKDEAQSVVAAQQGHFEWGRPFGLLLGSRHLLENADAIICVGYSEYEAAKEKLPADRVHHLPNGVEPGNLTGGYRSAARERLGIKPDDFLFGCISRLDPQKNQKLLLEAWLCVRAQKPNARLLLCGPATNADYARELEQLIEESGFASDVHLLPAVEVESQAHKDLLAALDCFVLASRHEPFGIVVLEAWATKTPVIASAVGGLQRLVTHEQTGLHFPSGDVEALATRMRQLIDEPGLGERLACAGQAEVQERYTWQTIAAEQESIYQQAEERYPS
ncbi:glycosyltransferase family 4 protein [Cerasicoccus fimbriatus]|uniref:glycosyltransferase family 4 protein n=1 Tax=Cerasicoccus fimbriatus TaxID=3014554 RepID=UPI0022B39268|nr:glycosyltransferase family 4 protein [Cerasicoccus sp. TK19100]